MAGSAGAPRQLRLGDVDGVRFGDAAFCGNYNWQSFPAR